MDLEALIAELMKQDRGAVLTALQNKAQPLFQAIFDKGHSEATGRLSTKVTEAETKLKTLEGELTKAKEQVDTLSKDKPDVQKYMDRVTALETEISKTKEQAAADLTNERVDRRFADLRASLLAKKVDPDYAEVIIGKADVRGRIVSRENKIEVIGPNGIPFTPVEGKSGLDLLTEELITKVPPKFIASGVDRGAGIIEGGPAPGGANHFDAIRAEVNARKPSGPTGIPAIEQRLGMAPATK